VLKKRKKSRKHYEVDEGGNKIKEKHLRKKKSELVNTKTNQKGGKLDWRDMIEDEEEEDYSEEE
jgi:hypothetical protein